jgi:hypothetical protein
VCLSAWNNVIYFPKVKAIPFYICENHINPGKNTFKGLQYILVERANTSQWHTDRLIVLANINIHGQGTLYVELQHTLLHGKQGDKNSVPNICSVSNLRASVGL